MNNRLPWRFSPKRFMSDTYLQSADLAVRGAWMQILCILWKENQLEMTLSLEDWSRLWRCSYTEAERIINVLKELIARHEDLLSLDSDENPEQSTTNRIWRATKKLPVATVRDHEGLITLAIPQPPPKKRKPRPHSGLPASVAGSQSDGSLAVRGQSSAVGRADLRNAQVLSIAEEIIQRREAHHRIEYLDIESYVKLFNNRTNHKEEPYVLALHFASHLTRNGWEKFSQAVAAAPAWMRVHQLCTDASPPEPRIWVV